MTRRVVLLAGLVALAGSCGGGDREAITEGVGSSTTSASTETRSTPAPGTVTDKYEPLLVASMRMASSDGERCAAAVGFQNVAGLAQAAVRRDSVDEARFARLAAPAAVAGLRATGPPGMTGNSPLLSFVQRAAADFGAAVDPLVGAKSFAAVLGGVEREVELAPLVADYGSFTNGCQR